MLGFHSRCETSGEGLLWAVVMLQNASCNLKPGAKALKIKVLYTTLEDSRSLCVCVCISYGHGVSNSMKRRLLQDSLLRCYSTCLNRFMQLISFLLQRLFPRKCSWPLLLRPSLCFDCSSNSEKPLHPIQVMDDYCSPGHVCIALSPSVLDQSKSRYQGTKAHCQSPPVAESWKKCIFKVASNIRNITCT